MGLTNDEKKALYVLKEIDGDGHLIKELGMGFLVGVEGDDEQFLVSSSSVLKHSGLSDTSTIQAERYHIPKKLFKKKDPRTFTFNANEIKVCDQSSFCFVKRNFVKQDGVKSKYHLKFNSGKEPQEESLYAIVFDGQEVVKLEFKLNKEGTFDLANKPKDYKVPEQAKGAPVVVFHHAIDNEVVGVLDKNCYVEKWSPVFFKPDTLKSATITIQDPGKIHTLPDNITKNEGQSVTFKCSLEGKPFSEVTWMHGDKEINTSDSNKYNVSGPSSVNNSTASLTINNLLRCDEGDYFCKAQNDLEIKSDRFASLTVHYPPKILRSPSAVTQTEAETVSFSCQYEGKPKSTVEWFLDDTKLDIHADTRLKVQESGNEISATSSLTITNPKSTDGGMYRCVIRNNVGTNISSTQAQLTTLNDVELYSKKLKSAILKTTEMQQKGLDGKELKTDDIFTNLSVLQGEKMNVEASGGQRTKQATGDTSQEIKKCSELFVDEKGENNPRFILVSGHPGVGKTLFSLKLVRDWANECIFDEKQSTSIPNIRFAYLLTFRQLNLIAEDKLSVSELLNRSCILNQSALVNIVLADYICDIPEQLFLILDGFDECSFKAQLTTMDAESNPNDSKAKMPVKDLINKLVWGKILKGCIIMITSRPGEARDLDKKIQFDRYVQITGFSEQQIIDYVEKYFNSETEEMKKMALEKVKGSAHYITFGRVPFMCHLMCIYIRAGLENNLTSDNSVPLTLTEFYFKVIHRIEKNYNREIKDLDEEHALLAVKQTLHYFTLLAAQLFQQDKFSFTKQDLKKLKLEKCEYLMSSNLLCCNLVASNDPCETTCEYSFNHFTLQEFFVARYFVSKNKIPAQKMTAMILTFMSGLMDADKNEELMLELLQCIPKQEKNVYIPVPVSMRCLVEYKLSDSFLTRVLSEDHRGKYWDSDGEIILYNISDCYCERVAMFVDKLSDISHTLTKPPYGLAISYSQLSCTGLCTLLSSLTNPQTTITRLYLYCCNLDDECVKYICQFLPKTKIIVLDLEGNELTDKGIEHMVHHDCLTKLTYLNLFGNKRVSYECRQTTQQHCSHNYPNLRLYI